MNSTKMPPAAVRTGGKGSVRRKKKAVRKTTTNDMKMDGAARTRGKGSVRRKKKKPVYKTVTTTTTDDKPKGNGNASLGLAPKKPDDDEDIVEGWGPWGHNHDLCIEELREPVWYPHFWDMLTSYDEDDDENPGPAVQVDKNFVRDVLLPKKY